MAVKFHHNELEARLGHQLTGEFTVEESGVRHDSCADHHTQEERGDHLPRVPSGQKHKFPIMERVSVCFKMSGDCETGIWSYTVLLTAATSAPVVLGLTLTATASQTGAATVRLSSWTDASQVSSTSNTGPVLLYTQVELEDSGTGYPDMTTGDGIYCAYFTGLAARPGYYPVQV